MANEYPLESNSFTKQIVSGGIQVEFPFPANPLHRYFSHASTNVILSLRRKTAALQALRGTASSSDEEFF